MRTSTRRRTFSRWFPVGGRTASSCWRRTSYERGIAGTRPRGTAQTVGATHQPRRPYRPRERGQTRLAAHGDFGTRAKRTGRAGEDLGTGLAPAVQHRIPHCRHDDESRILAGHSCNRGTRTRYPAGRKQLAKVVNVISVRELGDDAVRRELVVLKVHGEEPDK